MTFTDFINKPQSKKITIVEVDSPLYVEWLNYEPGIWYSLLTTGNKTFIDDFGNVGFWGPVVDQYFNIQSLSIDGSLYTEQLTLADCIANEMTWFYDTATTYIYVHFNDWLPPEYFNIIAPGAAIGFTNQIDEISNNYFEDIYYEPLITSVPNFTKKKDALFFGIIQYQGGSISFNNAGGYFDDFAQRDLYGQPVRVKISFEGLPLSEQLLVYTGRVEDFSHNLTTFSLKVSDIRKLLSRSLPVNTLSVADYPSMDDKLDGTPIPIAYGPVIKAPAYKTSSGNWIFCDTEFNAVDFGITVYNEDGTIFTHGGTETDGTFTGTDTDDKLFVSFSVSSVSNGLDIISDMLNNYEDISFTSVNYDLTEWNTEKPNVKDCGIWIGKGNILSSVDVIELICVSNDLIFDVLSDGRFTSRRLDKTRTPTYNIKQDELLEGSDVSINYDSAEYLSSVRIGYSKNIQDNDYELYTNTDFQDEVYGRYRQYKENNDDKTGPSQTALTNQIDAIALSNSIMEQSKFIYPKLSITTKTQNIAMRILDNITFEYKRQNGKIIIPNSLFQVLSITLNLSTYEMNFVVKLIEEYSEEGMIIPEYIFTLGNKKIPAGNYKITPDGKRKIAIISRTEA